MLRKFSVTNFKGFNSKYELNFGNSNNYEFNIGAIENGVVKNAIIYGHNGVGKSNLGLAIFDIIGHLTDKNINENEYKTQTYLNAYSSSRTAKFEYEFIFGKDIVSYVYEKNNLRSTVFESLEINTKLLAKIDRRVSNTAIINILGTETLNRELTNSNLSLLKYIKNNSIFEENNENKNLQKFYDFVDHMLFFRSLDNNMYMGFETGVHRLEEDIIKNDNVKDLELFLNKAEIKCSLKVVKDIDQERIAFYFDHNKSISLFDIASTGTKSLILFYFWLQRLRKKKNITFLFIDEFDAFYHHELSYLIVEEIKKTNVQFVLTSHNTSIISNDLLRPDCYFIMTKEGIQSFAKSTEKELREAHNIEKMYKSGSFDV
jgi:AAA15 family ATPase/GTPase